MKKDNFRVIGVMSGTSLDGVDLVDVSFSRQKENWKYTIHNSQTIEYDAFWKENLSQLVSFNKVRLATIDIRYTLLLAELINRFISKYNINEIDAVCSHGHTALHEPENGLTYQIGNHKELALEIEKRVVCDFRVQDVKLGGQGAPLVPIGDKLLFNDFDFCLNLGGFANISFDHNSERIAYDICPVNIVMNYYTKQQNLEYDDEGQLAASGAVNNDLLSQLNKIDFYDLNPPKSLGLEWVKAHIFPLIDSFKLPLNDILRTFVEHIAIQIANEVNTMTNAKILVTGGGVFNHFLIQRLEDLSLNRIEIPSNNIINFKEALIFGFLGVLKLSEEVNCLSSVTGAKHDHSSGKIFLP